MSDDPFEGLGRRLPARELDPREVEDLVSGVQRGLTARRRQGTDWRAAIAAAAVLLAIAGLAWWSIANPPDAAPLPVAETTPAPMTPPVEDRIQANPSASYELHGPPEDRVVSLASGRVHVTVDHRAPGERFRVIVGAEQVEVTGTEFDVVAEEDTLLAVLVQEGEVVLRRDDGSILRLAAGDRWRRPDPSPDPEPMTPAPVPTVTPTVTALGAAFDEGLAHFDAEDFALARDRFASVTSGPLEADARFWAAISQVRLGPPGAARSSLEQALAQGIPPERRGTVACLLARLHLAQGSTNAATPFMELAAADPDPAVAACGRDALDR